MYEASCSRSAIYNNIYWFCAVVLQSAGGKAQRKLALAQSEMEHAIAEEVQAIDQEIQVPWCEQQLGTAGNLESFVNLSNSTCGVTPEC